MDRPPGCDSPTTNPEYTLQGVIKSYDPGTGDGVVLCDTDLVDYDLADGALAGSVFRMLRQGQRVNFELDGDGRVASLRIGSEVDMGTRGFPPAGSPPQLSDPTPEVS
ncbi:hypothetical protein BH18ACT4_BH18ACT4_00790 [soil metagenome]